MNTASIMNSFANPTTSAASETTSPVAAAAGVPLRILRLEGAAVLAASLALYAALGGSWALFAVGFLLPDLSLLGYLATPRVGAVAYNVGHSLLGPALLAALAVVLSASAMLFPIVAIWVAHIGFDRMLGYGLKYETAFGDTHLGRVGVPGRGKR